MELVVDPIIYRIQSTGGISRLYREILPRMCDIDPSLHITLLTGGPYQQRLPAHALIDNLNVFPLERLLRPGRFWWRVAPEVRQHMQAQRIGSTEGKIWQSTYFTSPRNWKGATVVLVADLIYDLFSHQYTGARNEWFRSEQRRCIENSDAIICISQSTQADVERLFGSSRGRTHVVPLAHSPVFFPMPGVHTVPRPTAKPFLLYVGMRSGYKNFDRLLASYSRWSYRDSVDLVVVGPKWSPDEQRRLTITGIEQSTHLVSDLDDTGLCTLYNQAVAFVYPSLYEGFGIPLLEAMASGCPIVASRIPSSVEVAGECPVYFDAASDESLLSSLDEVLLDSRRAARTALGLKIANKYNWNLTAQQTLAIYRSLDKAYV